MNDRGQATARWQAGSVHGHISTLAHQTGKVISLHSRALNVLLEEGEVLSLLHPTLGNGPGAVLISEPDALFEPIDPEVESRFAVRWPDSIRSGHSVQLDADAIHLPGLTIDLTGATAWSPPNPPRWCPTMELKRTLPPHLQVTFDELANKGSRDGLLPAALATILRIIRDPGRYRWSVDDLLSGRSATSILPGSLARTLFQMGSHGINALMEGDWGRAVPKLSGLGPGLTPSGDDLLAGFACTLARTSGLRPALQEAIAGLSPSSSPPLSRYLLHCATQGVAGEHQLAWLDAIVKQVDQPALLERVLSHGATSGADWAAGAILALTYIYRKGD